MEGFINTCDFFLISGKGGSVFQKLNHIIYSFLYHDFHLLIDRNFSMFIIVSFFYSFFFFFLTDGCSSSQVFSTVTKSVECKSFAKLGICSCSGLR